MVEEIVRGEITTSRPSDPLPSKKSCHFLSFTISTKIDNFLVALTDQLQKYLNGGVCYAT